MLSTTMRRFLNGDGILGKLPDAEIAAQTGRTKAAVRRQRNYGGIPMAPGQRRKREPALGQLSSQLLSGSFAGSSSGFPSPSSWGFPLDDLLLAGVPGECSLTQAFGVEVRSGIPSVRCVPSLPEGCRPHSHVPADEVLRLARWLPSALVMLFGMAGARRTTGPP
jgi:hypothetical protein